MIGKAGGQAEGVAHGIHSAQVGGFFGGGILADTVQQGNFALQLLQLQGRRREDGRGVSNRVVVTEMSYAERNANLVEARHAGG